MFSCEISEIFKNTFFTENLRWLLLLMTKIIFGKKYTMHVWQDPKYTSGYTRVGTLLKFHLKISFKNFNELIEWSNTVHFK